MPAPHLPKQTAIIVKPRAGNKSAQLVRSIQSARIKRKVPTSIGSVSCTADLATGEGITMKKPYTLADLSVDDRKKIAEWLVEANSCNPKERPGFASLDAKLERVLVLLTTDVTYEQSPASIKSSAVSAYAAAVVADALERLELVVEEALAEVRTLYDQYAAAGVKLTNVSYAKTIPKNSANAMDLLQSRVNRIRFETLPKFHKGCQNIGIIRRGAGDK